MSNYKSKTTVYEKKADGSLFPLGQVVPNIDERVRQLENYPSAVVVTKPTISGDLSLPDITGGYIELTVSAQSLLPDSSITKFEYWLNAGEKQVQTASLNSATITIETPEDAEVGEVLDLYVRAYDNFGSSNINAVALTVVSIGVETPTISGKTTDFIAGGDTLVGSEFTMIGIEGNHDKSDWVLYKVTETEEPEEIWSSIDDTENLTSCPSEISEVLEVSTTYIIKVRYHDSINNIWSEYGELLFSTAEVFRDPWEPNVSTSGIHFITSTRTSGINIFTYTFDDCEYEVWINNVKTDQDYTNIIFEAGDEVLIKCISGESGKFPAISFSGKNYIKEILEPFPLFTDSSATQPVTSLNRCFYICSSLTSIPENLFSNNTAVTSFSGCFLDCSGLTSIPENLFSNNTAVTTFASCFKNCSGLTSIPENLFSNNTAVTDFSTCFENCRKLASIPDNLFSNNIAVTNFSGCFRTCSVLTSIPENLFSNNTAVTTFASCFNGCPALTSIPENLFSNNTAVTDFNSCFKGCPALTSIPENLFSNNTAVTSFSDCFLGCSGLTSIPSGLFSKNTKVTNFAGCFSGCTNINSILGNLFYYNTAVTTFSRCFKNCSGLTSIPSGLFNRHSAVTDFSSCFLDCSGLASIPENLFSNNTEIYSISDCFSGCSGLVVTVRIGAEDISKASNFAKSTKSIGTVYVPLDSKTASTFKSATDTNVNVIEE